MKVDRLECKHSMLDAQNDSFSHKILSQLMPDIHGPIKAVVASLGSMALGISQNDLRSIPPLRSLSLLYFILSSATVLLQCRPYALNQQLNPTLPCLHVVSLYNFLII